LCFADDTVFLVCNSCPHKLKHEANIGINLIKNWLGNNSLQLNYTKSNFIHFRMKNNNDNLNFGKLILHTTSCKKEINNCVCPLINKTSSVKYLGIHLDEFLKWNVHIDKLIKSVRKFFYVFKCLKNILTINVKTVVYKSLVQSIVSYGIAFWGNAFDSHIKKTTYNNKLPCKIYIQ